MLGALRQVGKVLVRQVDEPAAHLLLGQLDEVGPELVADAARAGVQHHPEPVRLVEAKLDEVVAGAERAEVAERARVSGLRVLLEDVRVTLRELAPAGHRRRRRVAGPPAGLDDVEVAHQGLLSSRMNGAPGRTRTPNLRSRIPAL